MNDSDIMRGMQHFVESSVFTIMEGCRVCSVPGVEPHALEWFQSQGLRGTCVLNAANHCLGKLLLTVDDMERSRAGIFATEKMTLKKLKKKVPKKAVHRKRNPPGYWTVPVLQRALLEHRLQLDHYQKIKPNRFFRRGGPAWQGNFLLTYYNEHGGSHMVALLGPRMLWVDSADKHAHLLPDCSWDAIFDVEYKCKYTLDNIHRIVAVNPSK